LNRVLSCSTVFKELPLFDGKLAPPESAGMMIDEPSDSEPARVIPRTPSVEDSFFNRGSDRSKAREIL